MGEQSVVSQIRTFVPSGECTPEREERGSELSFNNHGINVLAWVGALSTAVSRGSAPLVVGACRRGSTRLTAVIGGLVLALASLFTSFAAELHQVLLR